MHNKPEDCWVVINNSVYDLSGFIDKHPGGFEVIVSRAGEDATSYFTAKHGNSEKVIRRLSKFKIGELPENECIPHEDFKEPFLAELITRCNEDNLYQNAKWYRNSFFYVRLLNIIFFFACSLPALYGFVHWTASVLLVIIQAIIGTSLFGLVAHEATHRNFPKNKVAKTLLTFFWPVFWPFIIKNPLHYEHNSHHVKIGDPEFDYEVAAFSTFIRYSGLVEHKPIHAYQHKLAAIFYPFYANIITTIGGIKSTFWSDHNRPINAEQLLSLGTTLLYFVLLPAIFNQSVLWSLVLYLIYQCTLFTGIYVGAAINHFVPSTTNKIPLEHENKFGYYACHNTTNFCSTNPFWIWYTGGFNIQIEHHLIPFIPVENLTKLIPIVKALCKKYNYPYKEYASINELWHDHYEYLRIMSQSIRTEGIMNEITNKTTYQPR